ncbi:MAG TPA: glycosyltransferase family 2 protein, partial [Candidatus Paceibacterota bacterium]
MKLSIITVNYNNAEGLKKTIDSVLCQTSKDFEYIVVDGASTDNSLEIIVQFENLKIQQFENEKIEFASNHFQWISEPDMGIYHAMNKGIVLAKGEYIQFLNSGDSLVTADVTERMLACLFPSPDIYRDQGEGVGARSLILYGNMLKQLPNRILRDRGFAGRMPTMLDFYTGTLNHSPAYIKRSLFETYGLYDENMKIVSDWKWYLKVIILNGVIPVYKDIDVTLFDMNGISTINSDLDKGERKQVLSEILPNSVLADYERWTFSIDQIKRINRYWITRKG